MQGEEQRKEDNTRAFRKIKPILCATVAGQCSFVSLLILLQKDGLGFCNLILGQTQAVKIGVCVIYSMLSIAFTVLAWKSIK